MIGLGGIIGTICPMARRHIKVGAYARRGWIGCEKTLRCYCVDTVVRLEVVLVVVVDYNMLDYYNLERSRQE